MHRSRDSIYLSYPDPVSGLAVLSDKPVALHLALFLLSEKGQAVIAHVGLAPTTERPLKLRNDRDAGAGRRRLEQLRQDPAAHAADPGVGA